VFDRNSLPAFFMRILGMAVPGSGRYKAHASWRKKIDSHHSPIPILSCLGR
jgi:hypothetical protein